MKHSVRILMTISMLVSAFAFSGCSDDDSNSIVGPVGGTGTLSVKLTDAPASYDAVLVTFSQVTVHAGVQEDTEEPPAEEGTAKYALEGDDAEAETEAETEAEAEAEADGWIVVSDAVQTFDLLTLSNGVTAVMGEAELDAGHYTQLRLIIDSAEVIVDGESHDLTVPSGTVKFVSGFDISDGGTTDLVVDFDASRSVHQTGGNNAKYMLKPTIRVIKAEATGSITGIVANPADAPIAYAIAEMDTVTSSPVDMETGEFTLAYLGALEYEVVIENDLGLSYSAPAVTVVAGQATDLGTVSLE
jgi:hypothetical protein